MITFIYENKTRRVCSTTDTFKWIFDWMVLYAPHRVLYKIRSDRMSEFVRNRLAVNLVLWEVPKYQEKKYIWKKKKIEKTTTYRKSNFECDLQVSSANKIREKENKNRYISQISSGFELDIDVSVHFTSYSLFSISVIDLGRDHRFYSSISSISSHWSHLAVPTLDWNDTATESITTSLIHKLTYFVWTERVLLLLLLD